MLNFIIFIPNFTSNQIITDNSSSAIFSNSAINVTHPDDIELFDQDLTNHTISWTLTDEFPKDYFGIYSFTNDSVGSNPAGWDISEPAGSNVSIITEKGEHRNVLNLTRYSIDPMAVQIFGSRTPSSGDSLEFWVYGSNGTRMDIDVANTGLGSGSYIWLQLHFYEQKLYNIYNGGANSNLLSDGLTEETWHHIRIKPTGTNAFQIWLDGIQLGPPSGTFRNPSTYTRIMFYCPGAFPGNSYVDAVDYSWVSGYYLNRNTNYNYTWPKDYSGAYSFTDDVDSSHPVNWTINENPISEVDIIAQKADHRKVVQLNYTSGEPQATQVFGDKLPSAGNTIEYWVFGTNGSTLFADIEDTGPGMGNFIWLQYRFYENKLYNIYQGGAKSDLLSNNLTAETWHHIRMKITSTTSFQIWLDGIQLGPVTGVFLSKSQYSRIYFSTQQNKTVYFDAIDYSWAPGYYLNRNMAFHYFSNLTSGVFVDGTQKTSWNRWGEQTQVNYKVNGLNLGLGIHNVSLAFNDTSGLWGHDDISVTVVENPIVSWDVPLDLSVQIDIGIAGNGKADIVFDFKNNGTTHLMNINFTIVLPAGWTAKAYTISVNQLGPNESAEIIFKIMVPKDQGDILEFIPINVEAYVYELAEEASGTIEVVVSGTKVWDIYIWLIVIVGSIAAAGTTSFYVIHTRRSSSTKLKMRTKPKSATLLKTTIPSDFPRTYTVLSENLKGKINNLKNLTDDDREILLEYINELDEEEALTYLESLEKIKPD